MSQPLQWFREGGFVMFPLLLLGVLGLIGAVVGLVVGAASRRRGPALGFGLGLLGVAVLCAGLGGASYVWSQQKIEAALAGVDPQMRDKLREVGESEAQVALRFGGGAAAAPGMAGLVLLALAFARGRDGTARR